MPARRVAGGIVVLTGRRWLGVAEWVQGTTDRRHKAGARLVRESPRRGGRFRRCPAATDWQGYRQLRGAALAVVESGCALAREW